MNKSNAISMNEPWTEAGCRVFCGEHAAARVVLRVGARLALTQPIELLDFGNRCDMYFIARELRTLTQDPVGVMNNIHLRRAFTAYQAATMMTQTSTFCPLLLLDITAPFLDENIPQAEAERLFTQVTDSLRRLSVNSSVVVGLKPLTTLSVSRAGLLERLKEVPTAFHLIESAENRKSLSAPANAQPRLF